MPMGCACYEVANVSRWRGTGGVLYIEVDNNEAQQVVKLLCSGGVNYEVAEIYSKGLSVCEVDNTPRCMHRADGSWNHGVVPRGGITLGGPYPVYE